VSAVRVRREPPPFRLVEVIRTERRSSHLTRITLAGPALDGFDLGLPAASVRLLLPDEDETLAVPTWRGNEFLNNDGSRPIIRTLTPLRFDQGALELDVEVVRHGQGPLSEWAETAKIGDRVAVSGTGRGYEVDADVRDFLLAGDESALPAIGVLLAALPQRAHVQVIIELRDPSGRVGLAEHPGAVVQWLAVDAGTDPGSSLADAVVGSSWGPEVRVWAAGEAASMQRIRSHLFDERGLSRSRKPVAKAPPPEPSERSAVPASKVGRSGLKLKLVSDTAPQLQ